eukprot:scaffold14475_cov107-Isochrysis_galbana.AAC.6
MEGQRLTFRAPPVLAQLDDWPCRAPIASVSVSVKVRGQQRARERDPCAMRGEVSHSNEIYFGEFEFSIWKS